MSRSPWGCISSCQRVSVNFSLIPCSCSQRCRLLPLDPLKHCLALGDCKIIILDPQRADLLENSLNDVASPTSRFIVIEGHEGKGHWRGMDDLSLLMSRFNGDADSVITADPDVEPEDNATIIFTSGTTGLPSESDRYLDETAVPSNC